MIKKYWHSICIKRGSKLNYINNKVDTSQDHTKLLLLLQHWSVPISASISRLEVGAEITSIGIQFNFNLICKTDVTTKPSLAKIND